MEILKEYEIPIRNKLIVVHNNRTNFVYDSFVILKIFESILIHINNTQCVTHIRTYAHMYSRNSYGFGNRQV